MVQPPDFWFRGHLWCKAALWGETIVEGQDFTGREGKAHIKTRLSCPHCGYWMNQTPAMTRGKKDRAFLDQFSHVVYVVISADGDRLGWR